MTGSDTGGSQTTPTKRRGNGKARERRYLLISISAPLVVLLLWEIVVRTGLLDQRFFPPPTEVFSVLIETVQSGEMLDNLAISLQRIVIGFFVGAVPAVILGLLMGWFRGVRAFFDPIVAATYPIPKIALLPILLLLLGLGEASKIAIVAIAVFFSCSSRRHTEIGRASCRERV